MKRDNRSGVFANEHSPSLLLLFGIMGLAAIWAGEFVHEVLGHCFFISLLGGKVTEIFVSPFAPYIPSRLVWEVADIPLLPKALIASAGIIMSLTVSFAIQFILSWRDFRHELEMALFWIAFWTFINTVAYMIIGLVLPYGDIEILMKLGVVSNVQLGIIGFTITFPGLFFISKRLKHIISHIFVSDIVEESTMIFWISLPIPFIIAEVLRSSGPTPPLIGGSILLLLLPWSYLFVSNIVTHVSGHDPRERQIQLKSVD